MEKMGSILTCKHTLPHPKPSIRLSVFGVGQVQLSYALSTILWQILEKLRLFS